MHLAEAPEDMSTRRCLKSHPNL